MRHFYMMISELVVSFESCRKLKENNAKAEHVDSRRQKAVFEEFLREIWPCSEDS